MYKGILRLYWKPVHFALSCWDNNISIFAADMSKGGRGAGCNVLLLKKSEEKRQEQTKVKDYLQSETKAIKSNPTRN